jgi:hypothetical protein
MKRVFIPALFFGIFATASSAQDFTWQLSEESFGPIKFGFGADQIERILHEKTGYNQFNNHGCTTLTTASMLPRGVGFTIDHKRLTRVSVEYYGKDPRPLEIKTTAGIGLGSSEDDVLKAYPGTTVKPNPADSTWHTLTWETPDHNRGLVFETDGKTVKSMRAGENPAIAATEGCR